MHLSFCHNIILWELTHEYDYAVHFHSTERKKICMTRSDKKLLSNRTDCRQMPHRYRRHPVGPFPSSPNRAAAASSSVVEDTRRWLSYRVDIPILHSPSPFIDILLSPSRSAWITAHHWAKGCVLLGWSPETGGRRSQVDCPVRHFFVRLSRLGLSASFHPGVQPCRISMGMLIETMISVFEVKRNWAIFGQLAILSLKFGNFKWIFHRFWYVLVSSKTKANWMWSNRLGGATV